MPTFTGSVVDDQILLDVAVSKPKPPGEDNQPIMCRALLDTGAQITAISKKMISAVGAVAIKRQSIVVASGDTIETKIYRVRLDIPIPSRHKTSQGAITERLNLRGKDLAVSELQFQPPNYDALIGMDFIQGFHINMYGGHFILSS